MNHDAVGRLAADRASLRTASYREEQTELARGGFQRGGFHSGAG